MASGTGGQGVSKLMFKAGSFLTYSADAGNCDAVVIVTIVECKLEKHSEIQEIKVMKSESASA